MTPSQSPIDAASTTWNPAFLKSVLPLPASCESLVVGNGHAARLGAPATPTGASPDVSETGSRSSSDSCAIDTSLASDDGGHAAALATAESDAKDWDEAKAWVMTERGRVQSLVTANAAAIFDHPACTDRTARPISTGSTGSTSSGQSSPRHVGEYNGVGSRPTLATGAGASIPTGSGAFAPRPGSPVPGVYAAALSGSPAKPLKVLQQDFQRAGAAFAQGIEANLLRPERLVQHVAQEKMDALWEALRPLRKGSTVRCTRERREFDMPPARVATARDHVATLAEQFPELPVDQIVHIHDVPGGQGAALASVRRAWQAEKMANAAGDAEPSQPSQPSQPPQPHLRVMRDETLVNAFVARHLADRHIIGLPKPEAFPWRGGDSLMASPCGWWIERSGLHGEPTQRLVVSADNLEEGMRRCAEATDGAKKVATILLEAARTGEMNVLESVITHAGHRLLDADARNHALCRAVVANRPDLIGPLLDRGADPAARVELNGGHAHSAFHFLASRKDSEMARGFVMHYRALLKEASLDDTVLHAVSLSGSATAVRCVLEETASRDINARNVKGETALHVALATGDKRIAAVLAESPALDLETRNARGKSYLYLALRAGAFDCARALMTQGASVDHATWRLAGRQRDPENATLVAEIRKAYRPNAFFAFFLWIFRLR